MNKNIKFKFLRALRSGNFSNNRGTTLVNKNGYSALGVLCAITGQMATRDNSWRYPSMSSGQVNEFAGLTPYQQKKILEISRRDSSNFDQVARYISRNIKARN